MNIYQMVRYLVWQTADGGNKARWTPLTLHPLRSNQVAGTEQAPTPQCLEAQ